MKSSKKTSIPLRQQIQLAFSKAPTVANTHIGERKISLGRPGSRTGLFPSNKNGGAVQYESNFELKHALMLELDNSVKNYRTQALLIHLHTGVVIPDFLIKKFNGTFEVHEVKPSAVFLNDKTKEKFALLEDVLSKENIRFKLIDMSCLPEEREFNELLHEYAKNRQRHWKVKMIHGTNSVIHDIQQKELANKAYKKTKESGNE